MANYGALIFCLFSILLTVVSSSSAQYTVGDSAGWALNVDYSTWTSDKTFNVGDKLVFGYGSPHTVYEVNFGDYSSCTIGNPIKSHASGSTTIELNTAGTRYFICGITDHCVAGMRLAVTVIDGGSTLSDTGNFPTTLCPPGTVGGGASMTPPFRGPSGYIQYTSSAETLSSFFAVLFSTLSCLFF